MSQKLITLALLGICMLSQSACVPLVVAGMGTSASATFDRRTYGTQLQDSEIEVTIMRQINKQLDENASISTTAYNNWVLLTGQTTNESSRAAADKIAASTRNVRKVFNETTVAWPSTVGNHASDTLTTSKVKTRLLDPDVKGISGHHVKIVTELGIVYLMGVVTQAEANLAVDIARSTTGVKKVVDLFEVLSTEEILRLDPRTSSETAPAPR